MNQAIGAEGFGTGFMDFIDDIGNKLTMNSKAYTPKEYEFSDGEGDQMDLFGDSD